MVENDKVRVGDKIVRRGKTPEDEKRFKQSVEREKQRQRQEALERQRKQQAKKIDKKLKDTNFRSLKQAKQQVKEIKEKNPNIGKFLSADEKFFENKLNKQKKEIQEEIKRARKEIKLADKRKAEEKAREEPDRKTIERQIAEESGQRAKIDKLQDFRRTLEEGEFIDVGAAKSFAEDVRQAREQEKELKAERERKREAQKKQSKQVTLAVKGSFGSTDQFQKKQVKRGDDIETTFINPRTKETFTFKGDKEFKDLKSNVKRDLEKQTAKKIINRVQEQNRGFKEKELRDLGFSANEAKAIKGEKSLEEIKNRVNPKRFETIKNFKTREDIVKTRKKSGSFEKELDAALVGKRVDKEKLKNLGLTENQIKQVTTISETTRQAEDLLKVPYNELFNKIKNIQTGDNKINNRILQRVYKLNVNQTARKFNNVEPINIDKPLSEFNKVGKKINDIIDISNTLFPKGKDLLKEKQKERLISDISKPDNQKILNKVRTGQTVSPKEFDKYTEIVKENNDLLLQKQKELFVTTLQKPANFAKRYGRGGMPLILSDVGKVIKGVGKGLGDAINSIVGVKGITINSKGESYDGIIAKPSRAIIDYSIKLTDREFQGKSAYKKLAKDTLNTGDKAKQLGKKTIDIAEFIKNNPTETAFAVGGAISAGVISSKKEFLKNPQENIGRMFAFLFPDKILKGLGAVGKGLGFDLRAEKYSSNKFQSSTDITTGKTNIKGTIKGRTNNNKDFTVDYVLRYDPKTKTFTGNQKTKIDNQIINEPIELKERSGFYVNTKTGEKLSKVSAPINKQSIKLKEVEFTPQKRTNVIKGDVEGDKTLSDVKVLVTKIADGLKTVSQRDSKLQRVTDKKTKQNIFSISNQLNKFQKSKKKSRLGLGITEKEKQQLENYLKSIGYDQELLEGRDKRNKLSIALGLRKNDPKIKAIENFVDEKGNVKKVVLREGRIKSQGEIIKGKDDKPLKINFPKIRPGTGLRKNKKGTVSLLDNDEISLIGRSDKTNKLKTQKTYRIPELTPKLPLNKANIRLYGIQSRLATVLNAMTQLRKDVFSNKINTQIKLEQKLNKITNEIKKINTQIKNQEKTNKQIQSKIEKLKPVNKTTKPVKRINVKKISVPKLKATPPKKPRRIRLPRSDNLPKTKTNREAYIIKIKSNNKVVGETEKQLPLRRAANIARRYIDKNKDGISGEKSYNLVKKGKTNIKDLDKVTLENKFKGTTRQARLKK